MSQAAATTQRGPAEGGHRHRQAANVLARNPCSCALAFNLVFPIGVGAGVHRVCTLPGAPMIGRRAALLAARCHLPCPHRRLWLSAVFCCHSARRGGLVSSSGGTWCCLCVVPVPAAALGKPTPAAESGVRSRYGRHERQNMGVFICEKKLDFGTVAHFVVI